MKIIGKKKQFAVEYEIIDSKSLMGFAKIWFGGNSIGTNEDLIFLKGYLINGLEQIGNSNRIKASINLQKEDVYMTFKNRLSNSNDYEIHKYLISLGTFTDDFTIFSFLFENEINIIWKLNSNNTIFSDLNTQSMEINYFKIDKNQYFKIFEKIKEEIIGYM